MFQHRNKKIIKVLSVGLLTLSVIGSIGTDAFLLPQITPQTSAATATAASNQFCPLKQSGDADCDGGITLLDFEQFRKEYVKEAATKTADFDGNGSVDLLDFEVWRQNYTKPITGTPTATKTPTATQIPTISLTGTPAVTSTPPGGLSNPKTSCANYPEKRIFLETQGWWMDTKSIGTSRQIPVNGIGGHAHTATCFPQDQKIAGGTLRFDVRLMLHKGQVGQVTWLDVGLGPDGQSLARVNLSITCPGGKDVTVMCEQWVPIEVDTAKIPSGYQELRFRFNIAQPNGERQYASTGWNAWFHGGTSTYRTPPFLEARGWYTGAQYANARLETPVPYEPISGIWNFKINANPGSGGIPINDIGVHVDPRFNLDDFGKIVKEAKGGYQGLVSLDTRTLTNGVHCLAIRASSVDKNGGTNTTILQFPIIVNNPGAPAGTGNGKGGCYPGT